MFGFDVRTHAIGFDARRFLSVILLVCALVAAGCSRRDSPDDIAAWVEQRTRAHRATPAGCSPDGRQVVFSGSGGAAPFGLMVRDALTGSLLASLDWPEPVLRVTWSPDGARLAFFSPRPGTIVRRLLIWEWASGETREIPIPDSSAQPAVRWSPDGRKLAFSTEDNRLVLATLTGEPAKHFPIALRVFDWGADSTHLAVAGRSSDAPAGGDVVSLLDVDTGTSEAVLDLNEGEEVRHLQWGAPGRIVLAVQARESDRTRLLAVDPLTRTCAEEFVVAGALAEMRCGPRGEPITWLQRGPDSTTAVTLARAGEAPGHIIDIEGHAILHSFRPHALRLEFLVATASVYRLAALDLTGPAELRTIASVAGTAGTAVEHTARQFTRPDGSRFSIAVSRCEPDRRARAAVVRMYPDARPGFLGTWAQSQVFLDLGIDCLHVVKDGVHGPADIVAACDLAANELGVPRERIIVLAGSRAVATVLDAALKNDAAMGGLALVGAAVSRDIAPAPEGAQVRRKLRVFAFHGELDEPERARRFLASRLGAEALRPPQGSWYVSPGEGHSLYVAESVVTSALVSFLNIALPE